MISPLIRSGYDCAIALDVYINGTLEILTGKTVSASLKNEDRSTELITDTTQSSATSGANYAAGLVVIVFSAAQTAALTAQRAYIEIAVISGASRTPCDDVEVRIEKGYTLT